MLCLRKCRSPIVCPYVTIDGMVQKSAVGRKADGLSNDLHLLSPAIEPID